MFNTVASENQSHVWQMSSDSCSVLATSKFSFYTYKGYSFVRQDLEQDSNNCFNLCWKLCTCNLCTSWVDYTLT